MIKKILYFLTGTFISLLFVFSYHSLSNPKVKMAVDTKVKLENCIYMQLKDGVVVIEMLPEIAPMHVKQIKELIKKKFYDGLTFHRVIEGFMAQGGDPNGDGTGGYSKKLIAEFSPLPHKRGAVSMARAQDPDSASSQFFIVTESSPFLDNQYTIWGYVIDGMEYVDNIKKGDPDNNGTVIKPDKIISLRMAIDVEHKNAIGKS